MNIRPPQGPNYRSGAPLTPVDASLDLNKDCFPDLESCRRSSIESE